MAVGFTTKERESITEALLRAAGRHAALSGMKKTSVDELCAEAGISKGAFYSFYPSKEHLFLTVMGALGRRKSPARPRLPCARRGSSTVPSGRP